MRHMTLLVLAAGLSLSIVGCAPRTVGPVGPVGSQPIGTDKLEGVPLTVPALFDFVVAGATMMGSTAAFTANLGYPTHVELHDDRPDAVQSQSIDVVAFSMP